MRRGKGCRVEEHDERLDGVDQGDPAGGEIPLRQPADDPGAVPAWACASDITAWRG